MKKLALTILSLAITLSIAIAAIAHADSIEFGNGDPSFPGRHNGGPGDHNPGYPNPGDPYPGNPYPGNPYPGNPYPGNPYPGNPYPGQGDVFSQTIRRAFYGETALPVRQILNIGPQFDGRSVEYIAIQAASIGGFSTATLVVDGRVTGPSIQMDGYMREHRFNFVGYQNVLGRDVRNIQLVLRGQVNVENLAIKLNGNNGPGYPYPGDRRENIVIQRNFQGDSFVRLADYADLYRRQGMVLKNVILRASTARGHGEASFCTARGCSNTQRVAVNMADYMFPVFGDYIDQRDIGNLGFQLRGNFWIDSVVLEFGRNR